MSPDADTRLDVEVVRTDSEAVVRLSGVFDAAGLSRFSGLVAPLLYERRQRPIRIDVSGLWHLSVCGVGALVFALQFASGHGQPVEITGSHGQPDAMLRAIGVTAEAMRGGVLGTVN